MKNCEPLLLKKHLLSGLHHDVDGPNLRVATRIGHGKKAGLIVVQFEVLVGELVSVNRFTSCTLYELMSQCVRWLGSYAVGVVLHCHG